MPPQTLSEDEYNQVKADVLKSAPPNLSEEQFHRWAGPQFQAALAEATARKNAGPTTSAAGRFASNLGSMINPVTIASGLWQAGTNPMQTGMAIGQQMADQWGQVGPNVRAGRYSEAVGHGLAGSVPVVGPVAANIGEQIGEGDVAGGLGAATGLLAPSLVKPAAKGLAAGARAVVPQALRVSIADSLAARAAKNVRQVMAPPEVGANKTRFGIMAEQAAPELAERPALAAWSRTGFRAKVGAAMDAATSQLDAAADARMVARSFETEPIIEGLKQQRGRLVAKPVEASKYPPTREVQLAGPGRAQATARNVAEPYGIEQIPEENLTRVAKIDDAIAQLKRLGPRAPYESLRVLREGFDKTAKMKYVRSLTQDFLKKTGEADGAADVTGVLREHLATFDPATAAANAEYSLFRKATDVLKAAEEVERVRPKVGRQLIARWTGAATGEAAAGLKGAVLGYVLAPLLDEALAVSPTYKLQWAKQLTTMADALRTGQTGVALSLAEKLKRFAKTGAAITARATARNPATSAPLPQPSQ